MRRRPQPSVRRGMLRATAAVVGLTVVVLAILLVVTSLTAPKAKAPIIPPTPTPGKSNVTPTSQATPRPTTSSTKSSKKKKSSMRSGAGLLRRVLAARDARIGAAASADGRMLAYFRPGDPYRGTTLIVLDRATGRMSRIGKGDPLVAPVWSRDGRKLLYVTVRQTSRFPGAEWTLVRSTVGGETTVLARRAALTMVPLGWQGGAALFLTSMPSDTSVYRVTPGQRAEFVSILISQVVTAARLAPDGHAIAFSIPTNCGFCNIDLFDMNTFRTHYGPSGAAYGWNFAWTGDSRYIVSPARRGLAQMDAESGSVRYVGHSAGLPARWIHRYAATLGGAGIVLVDSVTGKRFRVRN